MKRSKYMHILKPFAGLTYFFSFAILILALALSDISLMMMACASLWLGNVVKEMRHIRNNIVYILFHMTFFLFLMGRPFINILYYGRTNLAFSEEIQMTVLGMEYVALGACAIGFSLPSLSFSSGPKVSIRNTGNRETNEWLNMFASVSKWLFYLSSLFFVIQVLERIRLTQSMGYIASYSAGKSSIPAFISTFATMNEYFFFGFCAAIPKKKDAMIPLCVYMLGGILTVFYGLRSTVMLRALFIVIYYVLRDTEEKGSWISKKELLFILILIPFAIWFMAWYGFARSNLEFTASSVLDVIYTLLNEQGISIWVLCYQQIFKDAVPMQQLFTFGELWTFLTRNIFARVLFGAETYVQNTVDMAMYGHSFGQTISFLGLGEYRYLSGSGMGTSFIAEVMQDFGWLGIVTCGMIYGNVMKSSRKFMSSGLWKRLFLCYMFNGLLYSPRDTAIGPFMAFFTFSSFAAIALMWGLTQLITNWKSRRRKSGVRNNGTMG